jgi:hypothetical protein
MNDVFHARKLCRRSSGRWPWPALLFIALSVVAGCGQEKAADKDSISLPDGAAVDVAAAEVADDGGLSDGAAADTGAQDTAVADVATDSADGFDVVWPVNDGECKPDCKGRVCGPDGCGSVCGFCATGQFCNKEGTSCGEFCKPDCAGKACGDNGCGGDCGTCKSDFHCGTDKLCYADDCKASCVDKVCGDDGCGKSCGSCASGDNCNAAGQCKPSPCKGIPAGGTCEGDVAVGCSGEGVTAKKTQKDCALVLPKGSQVCGWDPSVSGYGCITKPPCAPVCKDEKGIDFDCGDDGCGKSCKSCLEGWACEGHTCKALAGGACGATFNKETGACEGNTWLLCSSDKIVAVDCGKAAKTCVWTGTKYGCK